MVIIHHERRRNSFCCDEIIAVIVAAIALCSGKERVASIRIIHPSVNWIAYARVGASLRR